MTREEPECSLTCFGELNEEKHSGNMTPVSGVVVSVDFGPYLAATLPTNARLFDETIVVTAADDTESIAIGQKCGARIVTTDRFWQYGAPFNKAAGLNDGLQAARWDYIYCFDADVILPRDAGQAMSQVDSETLYGLSRFTRKRAGEREWQLRGTAADYIVGYSQLFCRTATSFPGGFCEEFTTAGHYDIEFMCHWPKELRRKITASPALHIGDRKVAWCGTRQTQTRCDESSDEAIPVFRLQHYPRRSILLVQRTDAYERNCRVSLQTDHGLLDVGNFWPDYYREVPWTYQCSQATLHIYANGGEVKRRQAIARR